MVGDKLIGQRVWFPSVWEEGTLDSILEGSNNTIIAYVIRRDDGSLFSVDMQVRDLANE